MTYEQFKDIAKFNGWEIQADDFMDLRLTHEGGNLIVVRKIEENNFYIDNRTSFKNITDVIKAAIRLAETPLDERVAPEKYYLKSILTGEYLNYYFIGDCYLYSENNDETNGVYQTKFTGKEIDEMENLAGFKLDTFMLEYVDDEDDDENDGCVHYDDDDDDDNWWE